MSASSVQCEFERKKRLGGFEKIAFAKIGHEVAYQFLGDDAAGRAQISPELARFLKGKARVAVDFGGEDLRRAGCEGNAERAGFLRRDE